MKIVKTKTAKLGLVSVLFMGLAGCVSLLPEPVPAATVYRLSSAKQNVPQGPNPFIVRIDRPSAATVFETKDILVSPDGRRLASAGGAEWAELIPVMVQKSFADVMGQNPNIVGVIPSSGARTDTRLHLTIKGFEAQFDQGEDAPPLAVVHYGVTHADASDRDLIGTYDVKKMIRADEVRVSAIVRAMDNANQQALEDILAWLEQSRSRS